MVKGKINETRMWGRITKNVGENNYEGVRPVTHPIVTTLSRGLGKMISEHYLRGRSFLVRGIPARGVFSSEKAKILRHLFFSG